jgi:hypothetical protein
MPVCSGIIRLNFRSWIIQIIQGGLREVNGGDRHCTLFFELPHQLLERLVFGQRFNLRSDAGR